MGVTAEANQDYNEHAQGYLQRTVWIESCDNWYKRGTTFHRPEAIRQQRWGDYKFEVLTCRKGGKSNRFAFPGNGYTKRGIEEWVDPGYTGIEL